MNLFSRRDILFITIRSHFACGAILIIAFENIYVLFRLHYSPAFSKKRNQRRFCLLHGFQFIFLWHFNNCPLHIFYAHRHRHRHTRTHTHTYINVYIYYILLCIPICVCKIYVYMNKDEKCLCVFMCVSSDFCDFMAFDFKRVISIPD